MVPYAPLSVKALWERNTYDPGAYCEMKGGIAIKVVSGAVVVLWMVGDYCVRGCARGDFGCYLAHGVTAKFRVGLGEMDVEIQNMSRLETV